MDQVIYRTRAAVEVPFDDHRLFTQQVKAALKRRQIVPAEIRIDGTDEEQPGHTYALFTLESRDGEAIAPDRVAAALVGFDVGTIETMEPLVPMPQMSEAA